MSAQGTANFDVEFTFGEETSFEQFWMSISSENIGIKFRIIDAQLVYSGASIKHTGVIPKFIYSA